MPCDRERRSSTGRLYPRLYKFTIGACVTRTSICHTCSIGPCRRCGRGASAYCYHSGCQGTYSRTSLSLLDSLTSARNTASTSSFWCSSLAVVLVPSHSASIQRRLLSLALVFSPSVPLTPGLPPPVTRVLPKDLRSVPISLAVRTDSRMKHVMYHTSRK